MYNGVGVATARGTGTSGYVQRNLSAIKPESAGNREWKVQRKALARSLPEERDPWLANHKAKRQIEVELLKLRHELETQGLQPSDIEGKISQERHSMRKLLAEGKLDLSSDVVFQEAAWEAKASVAFGIDQNRT